MISACRGGKGSLLSVPCRDSGASTLSRLDQKAARIAGVYAACGVLWIVFSDQLLGKLVSNADVLTRLQTYKGWLFVFVTAVLVFFLSRQALARQSHLIEELRKSQDSVIALNAGLERRVAKRTAELEAANRELEAFSYSVSHDLKTPLRGIDGYSQILLEEYADRLDAEGLRFLQNIRHGAAQMHQLIEDLLSYSRIERRSLDIHPVDLAMVVRTVTDECAPEFEECKASLRVDVPSLMVRADVDGLAMVLRNLLANAVKFSARGKTPSVEIGARQAADRITLWVRDNGIGFDMKFHDRIFEVFARLERAEQYPGTGIGLALVKKAAERMGGRVWAESTQGRGATFFVELPA
jgi:signal transduction histidine kinase